MRKNNKIFEALNATFDRVNSPFCIGCVKPDESEALDELFAIPESVASPLLSGMETRSEPGAAGAPARAASSSRGNDRAGSRRAACPPTTNRGALKRTPSTGEPSKPDRSFCVGPAKRCGANFGDLSNVSYYGGYDGGCEIGYYGAWADPESSVSFYNLLKPQLAALKEQATKCEGEAVVVVNLAGVDFVVGPRGSGGRGCSYAYILKSGGVTLLVHENPKGGIQPIRVHFGFTSLHNRAFFSVVERVEKLLADVGFEIERSVVSRVDLQVTLTVDPQVLFSAICNGQSVASARRFDWRFQGSRMETFTAGSDTQICIYDKAQELLAKQDTEKLAAVSAMFPDGFFELTRVEYRLRRDALRNMEIHSWQDLKEKEADLIDYLTGRWFRILNCRPSKGNETRCKAHPVWKLVTYAFKTSFDDQNDVADDDKKPLERRDPNVVRCEPVELENQFIGVLASWLSKKLGYQTDIQKAWRYVIDFLELQFPQIVKKANYRARKTELERGVFAESSDSLAESSSCCDFDDCGGGRSSVLDWLKEAVVASRARRLPTLFPDLAPF